MKHLSFFKSFTKADWKAFVGFTLLNIRNYYASKGKSVRYQKQTTILGTIWKIIAE